MLDRPGRYWFVPVGRGPKNEGLLLKTQSKEATGTIEWRPERGGRWVAKITSSEGRRFKEEMLNEGGAFLFTDRVKDEAAARRWAQEFSTAVRDTSVPMVLVRETTVRMFGEEWTSGKLLRKHGKVKRLKIKKSVDDDVRRLEQHVYPYIGSLPVVAVTDVHIEHAFAEAWSAFKKRYGYEPSSGTQRQVYMVTHRLFDLSVRPGRLRKDNPVGIELLPEPDPEKIYSFLYPSELLLLLACTDIPIERRVYYALATYTGLRKGSIQVRARRQRGDLNESDEQIKRYLWSSIDLEHSTVMSLVNKNGRPQLTDQLDDNLPGLGSLIELLRRWREYKEWPPDSAPVIETLHCRRRQEAATLRQDLLIAGVTRGALFANTDEIQALRFHDLRATFVTWAKRAGKNDGWIKHRTGHITDSIMERYNREANSVSELRLKPGPFPDISTVIPELAEINVSRIPRRRR